MHHMKYTLLAIIIALAACAPKVVQETTSTKGTTSTGNFRSMPPKAGPARAVEIGNSHQFTLGNGLKVIVVENHKLPQISYNLSIDRDPILEKEKAGLLGIAGELLATGTTSRSKAEIDEAVDYIGANLSTSATGGFASSLTKHTDKVLTLFADVILKPSFPQSEFEKIKNQTLSNLQSNKDDPGAISANISNALTYGLDHPYGEITNEITVANVTLEDTKQFYKSYFKPGNAYLVIVGDITPDVAKAKAEKYFGSWTGGKTPAHQYAFPKPVDQTAVAFVDKAGAVQSVINVAYPVPLKPGEQDEIAARVMNTILGSGFSGRLFKNLREDKAYTYGAYSRLNTDKLVGSFTATASVRNEVTDSAIHQFLYELNKLKDEPVTKSELELAKSYIAGEFARSLENPQTVANFALNTLKYGLPENYYETYLQRLQAVTVEDVTRVAKKYITPSNARIIVVGNKDDVMPKLVGFDKEDGRVQLYDIYANPRKDQSETAVEITAGQLLDKYFEAIGGKSKITTINSIDQTYSMDLQGMVITARVVQDKGKFFMSMSAPGMDLMKQVYDGTKGVSEQMGAARMEMTGKELDALKEQSTLFPERNYVTAGYTMELKGIEDVNGKPAYKLAVTKPSGGKSVEYYDKMTFLKLKEIQTVDAQSSTYEYSDYKPVDGILIPHTLTISGPMPMPMIMKAQSVKLNATVDQSLFKI